MKAKYVVGILALSILYLAACSNTPRQSAQPLAPSEKQANDIAVANNSKTKASDKKASGYKSKIEEVAASWGQLGADDIDKICQEVKGLPQQPAM